MKNSDLNFLKSNWTNVVGTNLKNSFVNQNGDPVVKITTKDLNNLEEPYEGSDLASPRNIRQKSQYKDPFEQDQDELAALFKDDQTPALFRGNSGIIDPNTLKRK